MEIWHLAIQKMANVKISEAPNFGRGPGGKEETEKDSEHISHSTDCLSESSKPTLRDSRRGKQVQSTGAWDSGVGPSRARSARLTLAGAIQYGREQDGGTCVGTPTCPFSGEDGAAPCSPLARVSSTTEWPGRQEQSHSLACVFASLLGTS